MIFGIISSEPTYLQLDSDQCPENFHKESELINPETVNYCLSGSSSCLNRDYMTKNCKKCTSEFLYRLILSEDTKLMECKYWWVALALIGFACFVLVFILIFIVRHLSHLRSDYKQGVSRGQGVQGDNGNNHNDYQELELNH